MNACAGADVDYKIGGVHRVLVVFNYNNRVADVTQMLKRRNKLFVVSLVQSDAWLVKNIHYAHKRRTDLSGEPNTLAFAAR